MALEVIVGVGGLAAATVSAVATSATAAINVKKVLSRSAKHVKKIATYDISGFETLRKPLDIILYCLKPEIDSRCIEICGALGVGKTVIMQNLNNHNDVTKLFDIVIWLTVSSDGLDPSGKRKNLGLEELQTKVMRRLNRDTTTPAEYKETIEKYLNGKKYLLLLDDVKESVDPYKIGFPDNWKEKGSKIVLTTRYKRVCPLMVDYQIEIGLLTPLEAEKMFDNILQPTNPNSKTLRDLRLPWCSGLPIAINIVAGHCKSKIFTGESWRTEANKLNRFSANGDDENKALYEHLSFCCEDLKDVKLDCFCYGALYSEECDIYIDHLLDCWMAENIPLKNGSTDRAHGQEILKDLIDRNLFQKNERKKYVKMHKLIRFVALHKLKTDQQDKCLVPSNEESFDQSNMDKWKGKRWISFADYKNLKSISDNHDCPELSTLFLHGNSKFKEFPNLFFTKVESLRVLDMMATSIESLPDSLTQAEKLAVLYLNECANLVNLPSRIGNLNSLEVLDIRGGQVRNLLKVIPSLKHLKRFLVPSDTFTKEDIFNSVPGLTKLEEMVIDTKLEKKGYKWELLIMLWEVLKP